jgi:hypothetical protein
MNTRKNSTSSEHLTVRLLVIPEKGPEPGRFAKQMAPPFNVLSSSRRIRWMASTRQKSVALETGAAASPEFRGR